MFPYEFRRVVLADKQGFEGSAPPHVSGREQKGRPLGLGTQVLTWTGGRAIPHAKHPVGCKAL